MMPKTLVTGGAGFIGSHVAEQLAARGHDVVVIDDLSGGCRANVPVTTRFIEMSICDPDAIAKLFAEERFDYVYHAAAYAAEGLSHFIRRFNYVNNIVGSINLINAAANHSITCFVFFSSIAVYGRNQLPMSETLVPMPEDPYGIAKYSVELDLRAAHAMFGLPFVIFRPHNVYGERQNVNDRFRNVVGIFCRQILMRQPLTIFGDGSQTRAFTYIGDISETLARAVEYPAAINQVFNIGAEQSTSVIELAHLLKKVSGADVPIIHLEARHEVVHAFSSHEAINKTFGDRSNTALEEGLRRTFEWARTQKILPYSKPCEIEVVRNMPPSWA
jgi:UDP-glucose 4-epimerase